MPELLQWLDSSRKTGALTLTWDAGSRRVFLLAGQVIATAAPGLWERLARVMEHGHEAPGDRVMRQLRQGQTGEASIDLSVRQLAEEDLLGALVDLVPAQRGQFHWTEDPDRSGDEWVSMDLSVRHMLFESMRRVDEVPDVERALPNDHLLVQPLEPPAQADALHRIVLYLAQREPGMTLSRLWLSLGLPRGVVMRAVYDLMRARHLKIDGGGPAPQDPIAEMLEKGAILLRERQFDAAGLVFSTLLQRDPADRRVREFARLAERENVAALYHDLPPVLTFEVAGELSVFSGLRPDERNVVSQLQSGWDVSAVVLASPLKELDALRSLARLVRLGVIRARQ